MIIVVACPADCRFHQVALKGSKNATKSFASLTKHGKKEAEKQGDLKVPAMFEGKFKKDEIEAFRKY